MTRVYSDIVPDRARRFLIECAIVFLAYYIAGKIGQATPEIRSSNLGPVWPAYGVALAAVLRCGPRIWPAILASAFLVAFQSSVFPIVAAGQAVAATVGALSGGALLKWAHFDSAMARLRDALYLVLFGALTSAMVSASLGVAMLYAAGVQAYSGLGPAWLVYWLGDGTGVLLITPLALTAANLLKVRWPDDVLEFTALILLVVLVCLLIFGDLALFTTRLRVLAFAVLPFTMWAAIRFGVSGASMATLVVATMATIATAYGSGPFAEDSTFMSAVLLDVFFVVLSVTGLTLAAVTAERARAEAEHDRLIREQAAVEARLIERQRTAAELRESEDKLRLILDSAAEGIFGIDLAGRFTFCNHACLRMLGYESDEQLLGKEMHALIQHSHADGTPRLASESWTADVLETARGVHVDDEVLWKSDGTSFLADWWSYPQRRGSDVVGAVVGFSDITQRKQAENKAAALRDQLAHLSRVGMLSALTGALAHEINQPLAAVRVNTEAALLILAAQPPALGELRDALNDIRSDNQRAGEVLQHVRTLLKKDATRREPVDINSTVSDVIKFMHSSTIRRGIRIELDLAPEPRPALGDHIQVQQVVLNLLMNACDAVQENERSLRRVAVKTVTRRDGMLVEVRDWGPGLSDEQVARIFEPFYTTKPDGMGLGLSICRAIVATHGGTLDATRNRDGGMVFSATFPFWQAAVMARTDAPAQMRREQL